MAKTTTPVSEEELLLIGAGIYLAQQIEMGLYGIAAHAAHLPAAQRERRFRDLSPETFLRGDPVNLKATLGQIATAFGEAFLIADPDLERLISDRNLIIHNFHRLFHANIENGHRRHDPIVFLTDFVERATHWLAIVKGLVVCLREAAAAREGRGAEITINDEDKRNQAVYLHHAASVRDRKLSTLSVGT